MSYHRASEAAPVGGAPTMTVCTNDVALGDLVEHGASVPVAKAFGDVEALVSEVVEVEHQRICLAAVHAWSLAEELDEVGGQFGDDRSFAADGVRDVALAVCFVVLAFVIRPGWPAVVVALTTGFAAPGIVLYRLVLPATSAGSCLGGTGLHEDMFSLRPDGSTSCGRIVRRLRDVTGSGAVW